MMKLVSAEARERSECLWVPQVWILFMGCLRWRITGTLYISAGGEITPTQQFAQVTVNVITSKMSILVICWLELPLSYDAESGSTGLLTRSRPYKICLKINEPFHHMHKHL